MNVNDTFHVNVVGNGPTTLVFAHGFGSDQTAWFHQIEAFKDQYRLVLFDLMGCGNSNINRYNPLEYNSLDRYSQDLLAICGSLHLAHAIYLGHSVSAMIGTLASLAAPEYFDKLIYVGGSPRYLNELDYIGGFAQADLDNLYATMADDYLNWANNFSMLAVGNAERPELGRIFARSLSLMRPDIAQSTARVIFETDQRAILPRVQHPVLILQTLNDIAVPLDVAHYLAAKLPYSTLKILDAYGHFPHFSAPDQVIDAIRAFIAPLH